MENKSEKRGFLWLTVVLALVLVALLGVRLFVRQGKAEKVDWEELGVVAADTSRLIAESRESGKNYARRPAGKTEYNDKAQWGQRENHKPLQEPAFEHKEKKEFVVELNSADTTDLMQIYGIGRYFANAIVKYRQKLGGYVCKEQLKEVYGMADDRYGELVKHLTLDSSKVEKIDVNTASIQELKRHPYIDYWQAKAIVELRGKGIVYSNADDLLKVSLIDEAAKEKMSPYLEFKH